MSNRVYRARLYSASMDTDKILAAINDAKVENIKAIEKAETRLGGKITALTTKVNKLECDVNSAVARITTAEDNINELMAFKKAHENELSKLRNASVMTEYHGKKFNLVVFGLKQVKDWETQQDLKSALKTFFDIINLDMSSFTITAIHRLQTKSGKKPLPLIFKLQDLDDTSKILDKVVFQKIKAYNDETGEKLGVRRQLPKRMQDDMTELKDKFYDARRRNLKPKWKLDRKSASMYYVVGNDVYYPERKQLNQAV